MVDRPLDPCYFKFTNKGVVGAYAWPGQHTEEDILLVGSEMMRLICPMKGQMGLFSFIRLQMITKFGGITDGFS